jgi:hypothetical protein
MGATVLHQTSFRIGTPGNNADPDDTGTHSWDNADTNRANQAKETPFFVRLQVTEQNSNSAAAATWQLYFDTDNNPAGATKATTTSNVVRVVDDTDSAIADQATTDARLCADPGVTREDGLYTDDSDETGKSDISQNQYTEFMWCVQFQADAGDSTDYYFFLERSDSTLDSYDSIPKVTTAAAAASVVPQAQLLRSMGVTG